MRNDYSSKGGDKKGDEGYHFASDFIHYNKIVGKVLHTMQDSYSRSHCYRDETSGHPGRILYFQGYDKQDSEKHKKADQVTSPGIKEAVTASTKLLKFHKANTLYELKVREFLERIYELAPGAGDQPAGGTHPDYAK